MEGHTTANLSLLVERVATAADATTSKSVLSRVAALPAWDDVDRDDYPALAAAIVRVVDRRVADRDHDRVQLAALAECNETTLGRVETAVCRELGRTASQSDIDRLRRQVVALTEMLAAIDGGQPESFRLPDRLRQACTPAVAAPVASGQSLAAVDTECLERTLARAQRDLGCARMGVVLHRCYLESDDSSDGNQ